jgi:hypothetical protein
MVELVIELASLAAVAAQVIREGNLFLVAMEIFLQYKLKR